MSRIYGYIPLNLTDITQNNVTASSVAFVLIPVFTATDLSYLNATCIDSTSLSRIVPEWQ